MPETKQKTAFPIIAGILFLLPPIFYAFNVLFFRRFHIYVSYLRYAVDSFAEFWNYVIVPSLVQNLLLCTWIGIVFLILALGFFLIKKTRIPACIGFGLLIVTILVGTINEIVQAIQYCTYVFPDGTTYQYFYLLYDLVVVGMYFGFFISVLLFLVTLLTKFKIKALGVIGCILMLLSWLLSSLYSYGLVISNFFRYHFSFEWESLLPFFDSMFFDWFYLSVIIPCFVVFVFNAKKMKALCQPRT